MIFLCLYIAGFVVAVPIAGSITCRWTDGHRSYCCSDSCYKKVAAGKKWTLSEWGGAALGLSLIWPLSVLVFIGGRLGERAEEAQRLRLQEDAERAKLLKEAGIEP